jgi:hypothetical protein
MTTTNAAAATAAASAVAFNAQGVPEEAVRPVSSCAD